MSNEIYKEINKEEYPQEVIERVMEFVGFAKKYINEDMSVCDIGAGNGFIAYQFDADMYDYYPAMENVRFVDLLSESTFNDKKYDAVILSHTLEHFEDGIKTLKNVSKFIEDGGIVAVAVPNAEYENNAHKPRDESVGHLSAYNRFSLEGTLNSSGFQMVEMVVRNFSSGHYELWAVAQWKS